MRLPDAGSVEARIGLTEVVDLACRLVAIPSFGPDHAWEAGVAQALEELFASEGLRVDRQPVADGRENLIATLPGTQDGPPLLIFDGHMDTVPPSTSMVRLPFAATVSEGYLWGRGAVDMKGGLAAMSVALIALARAGVRPPRPLMLAAVAMEELGNVGTFVLAHSLPVTGLHATFAVVAEPTGLNLVTAHKGVDRYRVTVSGKAAHASTPQRGLNAIVRAAHLIAALDDQFIRSGHDAPHPLLGPPSYNIGTIQGGISRNTVPDRCTFQIEKRYLPGDTPARIRAVIEEIASASVGPEGIEVSHEAGFDQIPHLPLDTPVDHPGVRALAAEVGEVTGVSPAVEGLPAFTDAAILQAAGIPAVVCGPGDLASAHADDERIAVPDLHRAARAYVRLALRLCEATQGSLGAA